MRCVRGAAILAGHSMNPMGTAQSFNKAVGRHCSDIFIYSKDIFPCVGLVTMTFAYKLCHSTYAGRS